MAEEEIDGIASATRQVRLNIDLGSQEKIFALGTFVDVVKDGNKLVRIKAISSLCLEYPEGTGKFDWPLHFCKCTIDRSGSENKVKINSQQKRILPAHNEPEGSH